MRLRLLACCGALLLALTAIASARDHKAVFGNWIEVRMFVGPDRDNSVEMKIRPLYMDDDLKEFTTGQPHQIDDAQFVVRRVYRLSDRLVRNGQPQPFLWQRGEWLLVDRSRGRVTRLDLPDFDPYYSVASWAQDWVAYCGISGDGNQVYAVVAKLDQRDPILRKHLRAASGVAKPDGECEAPRWEAQPGQITFFPVGGKQVTLTVAAPRAD